MAELNNGDYLHGPHVDPGSDFVKKKFSQFSQVFSRVRNWRTKKRSNLAKLECLNDKIDQYTNFDELQNGFSCFMLLAYHVKSYLICVEFSKYYVIFIYFQAAVSVLYVEKNQNRCYIIFRKFENSKIQHISNIFSYDMPSTSGAPVAFKTWCGQQYIGWA